MLDLAEEAPPEGAEAPVWLEYGFSSAFEENVESGSSIPTSLSCGTDVEHLEGFTVLTNESHHFWVLSVGPGDAHSRTWSFQSFCHLGLFLGFPLRVSAKNTNIIGFDVKFVYLWYYFPLHHIL